MTLIRRLRRQRFARWIERLESRQLLTASPLDVDGIGYFPHSESASIERFDIAEEKWLSPVVLEGASQPPTALHVDVDGIYAAFDREVFRYKLDGSTPTNVLSLPENVISIHSTTNFLFLNSSLGSYGSIVSIDKHDNTVLDESTFNHVLVGTSIEPENKQIFGRTQNGYYITYVSYENSGDLSDSLVSYNHNSERATQTWVFDNQEHVIDDSGIVFSTRFNYSGRLGTNVTDIDFYQGTIPIVLDSAKLTSYTTGFLPERSYELASPGDEMLVNDNNIIVFRQDATLHHGYSVETVPLNLLTPPEPGEPVDPVGLIYTPDEMFVASDGTLLIHSKTFQSIFRWDPISETYTQSIRLLGPADNVAYSEETNTLYTTYADGLIRSIDLSNPAATEVAFYRLEDRASRMLTAGPYVMVTSGAGWPKLSVISSDGVLADSDIHPLNEGSLVWDATNRQVVYLSPSSSRDLVARTFNVDGSVSNLQLGELGPVRESPFRSGRRIGVPVSVAPDGSILVLGTGAIFNAQSLTAITPTLSNTVIDFAWLEGGLFSIRNIAGVTQIQRWTAPDYQQDGIRQLSTEALRIIAVRNDILLLVSMNDLGIPEFLLVDYYLNDADGYDILAREPMIDWEPPEDMVTINPLGENEYSVVTNVPGTLTFSPPMGTFLEPGKHTISVTFIPDDLENYRVTKKSARIRVYEVDFGDAPAELDGVRQTFFPTKLEADGARHTLRNDLKLGTLVDGEPDAMPTLFNESGDNLVDRDEDGIKLPGEEEDEDGVEFPATIFSLTEESASSLAVHSTGVGYVSAWIDFNHDGQWNNDDEHVAVDVRVKLGTTIIPFPVPANSVAGLAAVRVRLSSQPGLEAHGLAFDGEVEDYVIDIQQLGARIETTPVNGGAIATIPQGENMLVMQGEHVLARYPIFLWNRTYFHLGTDDDEVITIPESMVGEILLFGDGKNGTDQIRLRENQHLDLTVTDANRIRNIEAIDLRGYGLNQLSINSAAVKAIAGNSNSLKLYYDSVDQVLFDGSWKVVGQITDGQDSFHVLTDGVAVLHVFNENLLHNPILGSDVNRDGRVTALDALLVINYLNRQDLQGGSDPVNLPSYLDVSDNQWVSPVDALIVINELNRSQSVGEGEAVRVSRLDSVFADYLDWETELRKRQLKSL